MDQDRTGANEKSTCGMYVVGLIDLLNQGKQLDGWSSLPNTAADKPAFIEALKRTVGQVHKIREAFKGFVEAYTRVHQETPAVRAAFTDEQNAECQRLTDVQLGRQTFSDTVVLYSPLAIPGGGTTLNGLHGMLLGSASSLLLGLAEAIPLRGGIEVGMAIDFFPGEIYGPVLRRAYLLEQNVAQYPRIVVGEQAIAYLRHCIDAAPGDLAVEWNRVMAKECHGLVARDQDGAYFVDFLSDRVQQMYLGKPDRPDYDEQVMKGHDFANREHERFMAEGNHKLALRYAWLRQYYEARIKDVERGRATARSLGSRSSASSR